MGCNPSPRSGCLCHLSAIGRGTWYARSPPPVSLSHCLTRKASSFLYKWPSFVTCAVALPVGKRREETDEDVRKPAWWQAGWKAEPTPAVPTEARLIPIVTTADTVDAVELAQTYTQRWPVQENII